MPCRWRNDGLMPGPVNAGIDRSLFTRPAGPAGALVRFHRSLPTASLGRLQAAAHELRLALCRQRGIAVVRRPTGGGALYLDPEQQCFTIVMRLDTARFDPAFWLERCARAVALGLARFGAAAAFKAPNDLEVDGRKIASVFVARRGRTVLLQGTVLLGVDVRGALEALRAPTEKLSADGLASARERLVTLAECTGRKPERGTVREALAAGLAAGLGLEPPCAGIEGGGVSARLSAGAATAESRRGCRMSWQRMPSGTLEALWRTAGGVIRARGRFDAKGRLERIAFAGDWQFEPLDALTAVQHALRGAHGAQAAVLAQEAAQRCGLRVAGADARDVGRVVALLWQKRELARQLGLAPSAARSLMVHAEQAAAGEIIERADALLVPYCAKPAWCRFRHREGCPECGRCEVGEAYRLGRERGIEVITITRYEHLVETLRRLRSKGARAYLGMCCASFFVKRHQAFREAGMPAVLMDISGANCYALREEEAAYAGRFDAEARIDLGLLRRVMRHVPTRGVATC